MAVKTQNSKPTTATKLDILFTLICIQFCVCTMLHYADSYQWAAAGQMIKKKKNYKINDEKFIVHIDWHVL